ncbi:acetate--CoA ligase family protein [Castellaniella sp. WN]
MSSENINESEGKALLRDYGVETPVSLIVQDASEVLACRERITPPLVVKLLSKEIVHKSDVGGVALGLKSLEEAAKAIEAMAVRPGIAGAAIDGWLIEEMVPQGLEIAVGCLNDPMFGPMVMLGAGGIHIELFRDVSFRLCPITPRDARSMIDETSVGRLLDGFRGGPKYDRERLVEELLKIGGKDGLFMRFHREFPEIDVNPLIFSQERLVAVDAKFIAARQPAMRLPQSICRRGREVLEHFRPLLRPGTVAVLGASSKKTTIANTFIRRLREFGYGGDIYPIHPSAHEIEGLAAYPSLAETPAAVDYAYVAIPFSKVAASIDLPPGRCHFVQIISSNEASGEEALAQERAVLEVAGKAAVRLVGPNCLGTYSPPGRLTFPKGASAQVGTIGIVSQSGGLSTDIIKRGQWRGLRLSGLVSVGNCMDVKPVELLRYFLADPGTRAIGLYIEDIKNGREFFDELRLRSDDKPVVILRGGATQQGQLAATSHTGALASSQEAWLALSRQTPVELVYTVDEFLSVLSALQFLDLRRSSPTREVALFGNGGGSSVLGTDCLARMGLRVTPFPARTLARLEALHLPPGTSVANPVDTPVRTLQEQDGFIARSILEIICDDARPDAIAMHLNLAAFAGRGDRNPLDNLISVVTGFRRDHHGAPHLLLALRSDRSEEIEAMRRKYLDLACEAGVPVFDEIDDMAFALRAVSRLEHQFSS